MTSSKSFKITYCKESNKLVGSSNFSKWKKRTDLNLTEEEVMGYIKGSTVQPSKEDVPAHAKYIKGKIRAQKFLTESIKDSLIPYVSKLETAKEIYEKLAEKFYVSTTGEAISLRQELYKMKLSREKGITSYLRISEIRDQLQELGEVMSDNEMTTVSRMRVNFEAIDKLAAWRTGAWDISTAILLRVLWAFISPDQNSIAALMQPTSPSSLGRSSVMAPSRNFHCAPPLRSNCSLADAEPCSRTNTGKRCILNGCVDLLPGIHITYSPFCNFSRLSSAFIRSPQQDNTRLHSADLFALSALQIMPRLRQRMRSRRGSSQGHVIRQRSPISSASSSDTSDCGPIRSPVSRRGRGRGRGHPLPPALFRLSSRGQTHSARLHYPCTLNNHTFLASVTIKLREVSAGLVMASPGLALEPEEDIISGSPQMDIRQSDPGGQVSQQASQHANPSVPPVGGSSGKDCPPPDDVVPDQYACPIVEEVPSPSNDV